MAVALSIVDETVQGDKRVAYVDATFSGNYATNGETVNRTSLPNFNKIEFVTAQGQVAAASTPTSGNPIGIIVAADGLSFAIRLYELGGAGADQDPLDEKQNAEAYLAGQTVRLKVEGF